MSDVYPVYLRRAGRDDPRTDPMYDCGCFGSTGCHARLRVAPGDRLLFIQPGLDESGASTTRIVFITPPLSAVSPATPGAGEPQVRLWPPAWEHLASRPLRFGRAFDLLEYAWLAAQLSPRLNGRHVTVRSLASHLRAYGSPVPVAAVATVCLALEEHIRRQQAAHGDTVFAQTNADTFQGGAYCRDRSACWTPACPDGCCWLDRQRASQEQPTSAAPGGEVREGHAAACRHRQGD